MTLEEKLKIILKTIEETSHSSVQRLDASKGHTTRSAGILGYEERQKALLELSDQNPEVIEYLCKKYGNYYFKFEGRVIKILSSPRDKLNSQVFHQNMFERGQPDLAIDPLLRITFQVARDIEEHEARITECHYIEIDRTTGDVLRDINVLSLVKQTGFVEEVHSDIPQEVQLEAPSLIFNTSKKSEGTNE